MSALTELTRDPSDLAYLAVGQIMAPRGLAGELKVRIEVNTEKRFLLYKQVYLGEERSPYAVSRARIHRGQGLLQLEGIADRGAAEALRDAWVYVHIDDSLPLEEDQYFIHDILGLQAVTVEGEELGRIREVLQTGANDVYVVLGPEGEILLPAIAEVITAIDLAAGTMRVKLLDGLR